MRTSNRNITLSARAEQIDLARKVAAERGETLNEAFRRFLDGYASPAPRLTVREIVEKYGTNGPSRPIPTRDERHDR